MIFVRIRRHSPAATIRFAPMLQAGTGLVATADMTRAGLAVLNSSSARHMLAGLACCLEGANFTITGLARSNTDTGCLPRAVMVPATVAVPLPRWRQGARLAARVAIAGAVMGGFGVLCLSYALACITVNGVLLAAVA